MGHRHGGARATVPQRRMVHRGVNLPIMKEWLSTHLVEGEDMLRHDKWLSMMWPRLVMETKGLQFEGNSDTRYKQALLERLTQAFNDKRFSRAGELKLEGQDRTEVVCGLVFEGDWRGTLEHRYFSAMWPARPDSQSCASDQPARWLRLSLV
jgi:hypothetical protein